MTANKNEEIHRRKHSAKRIRICKRFLQIDLFFAVGAYVLLANNTPATYAAIVKSELFDIIRKKVKAIRMLNIHTVTNPQNKTAL